MTVLLGLLVILLAVGFWLFVGFVLQQIVTRAQRELDAANHWHAYYERRQARYKELLGPEDNPRNHWSRGPYGGLPDEE